MMESGDPVLVHARTFYREKRLGIVLGPCKDHEYGIRVRILDPKAPIKEICADVTKGDSIETLNKL